MFYVSVRFEGLVQVLNFIQNMAELASGDYGCVLMLHSFYVGSEAFSQKESSGFIF